MYPFSPAFASFLPHLVSLCCKVHCHGRTGDRSELSDPGDDTIFSTACLADRYPPFPQPPLYRHLGVNVLPDEELRADTGIWSQ